MILNRAGAGGKQLDASAAGRCRRSRRRCCRWSGNPARRAVASMALEVTRHDIAVVLDRYVAIQGGGGNTALADGHVAAVDDAGEQLPCCLIWATMPSAPAVSGASFTILTSPTFVEADQIAANRRYRTRIVDIRRSREGGRDDTVGREQGTRTGDADGAAVGDVGIALNDAGSYGRCKVAAGRESAALFVKSTP